MATLDTHGTSGRGWIGVDLDGTLAKYTGWQGDQHIGDPVPAMITRVKRWLSQGRQVRILTARTVHEPIAKWLQKNIGRVLSITNKKDKGMIELWDDRAVQVRLNTGQPVGKSFSGIDGLNTFAKAGPYMGPRGGKWADPQRTIPWHEPGSDPGSSLQGMLKRRGAGEGKEIKLTHEQLIWVLKNGTFGLISAGKNPKLEPNMTEAEQKTRHEKLRADLKAGGYVYTEVDGHYEGAEPTFLVMAHNLPESEAKALGKKYNQDSVIHAVAGQNKMHFTTGENEGQHYQGSGYEEKPAAKDYYTIVRHPDGSFTQFALNFDWSKLHKSLEAAMLGIEELETFAKGKKRLSVREKVIRFFTEHPNPKDEEVHKWAESQGWEPDDVETVVYTLATEFAQFDRGGKSVKKKITRDQVDPKQLAMGIEVELEHTPNRATAERIALDHLAEFKDYYTRLRRMEMAAEKELKKAGPYIGPKGGKWADAKHTIPWKEGVTEKISGKQGKGDFAGKLPTVEELGKLKAGSVLRVDKLTYEKVPMKDNYGMIEEKWQAGGVFLPDSSMVMFLGRLKNPKVSVEKEGTGKYKLDTKKPMRASMSGIDGLNDFVKAGPYIGPKGGKWADPQHTIPWKEGNGGAQGSVLEKPQYDVDFRAGFEAGKKAFAKNPRIDKQHADKAYNKVSKKHGSYYVDGFTAAIDHGRHAYATPNAKIAGKLGLFPGTPEQIEAARDKVYDLHRTYMDKWGSGMGLIAARKPENAETIKKERAAIVDAQKELFRLAGKDWKTETKRAQDEFHRSMEDTMIDFNKAMTDQNEEGEDLIKTYTAIRNAYEKKYGAGSWKKIKVSTEAKESEAKPEKLPFGAKKKLGPEEHERYTQAKKRLAGALGMPTEGWGLYGRSILGALKNKDKKTEKSFSGIEALGQFALQKSLYAMSRDRDVGAWAYQFDNTKLRIAALECVQEKMQIDREEAEYRKTIKSYSELRELPGKERDRIEVAQQKRREEFRQRRDALEAKSVELEQQLVELRLERAKAEDAQKSMEDDMDLEKAQGMPTGDPKMGSGPEQGGSLAGKGKTSGSGDSDAGPAIGAPPVKTQKLSEDDEEDEKQLRPHKKPIEKLASKSMDTSPQGQRDSVAHERAMAVSRLEKGGDDLQVGVGIAPPERQLEQAPVVHRWNQGSDSRVLYSDAADQQAAALAKSDDFYPHGAPTTDIRIPLTQQAICTGCKSVVNKSLASCPVCGLGALEHQMMPGQKVVDSELNKSDRKGPMLRPKREQDLVLPDGYDSSKR